MQNKWHGKRKGWIKLNAVININNFQIIDYSIVNEHNNDAKEGIKIIKRIKNKINKLYGDKGYDSKLIYNELKNKAVIPVIRNAVTLSRGSIYGSKIARFIKRFGETLWKINNNYGLRWNIEIYFSEIKRLIW